MRSCLVGWLAAAVIAAGCGSDVTVIGHGAGGAATSSATTSESVAATASVASTSSSTSAGTTTTSGGEPMCCAEDEVVGGHACMPTLELGCTDPCTEGGCPDGYRCDACAASGPCFEEICQPACVRDAATPSQGIAEGELRIAPTTMPAGQATQISIRGVPLYVGALWYEVRVGDVSEHTLEGGITGGPCEQGFSTEAMVAGTYAVWVSQYGGGEPWVLAGILTVGGAGPGCAQPGYECAGDNDCCATPHAPTQCAAGRCMSIPVQE